MKFYKKIKYPCGLEQELSFSTILLSLEGEDVDEIKECPLHGKSCGNRGKAK